MINSWEVAKKKMESLAETRGFKADLARRLNIGPSALQNYFDGKRTPGLDQLDRFASALGIQPWELIKPGSAWPTNPKQLSALEHLEAAAQILRMQEKITFSHKITENEV